MKEIVDSINRKRAQNITTDTEAQSDAIIRRQGDYDQVIMMIMQQVDVQDLK